jgi:hypothetical protein
MERKTIEELVRESKCRKLLPAGVTEHGEYWIAPGRELIATYDMTQVDRAYYRVSFESRHYRDGSVDVGVSIEVGNEEKSGWVEEFYAFPEINAAVSIEEVACCLVRRTLADGRPCLRSHKYYRLGVALLELGVAPLEPAPDSFSNRGGGQE